MKRPLLWTTLLLLAVGSAGWRFATFTFEQDGRIWIEGTSSLHDWECAVEHFAGTLDMETQEAGLAALSGTSVTIPVPGIDCDNGTMNGKLRDALGREPIRYTLAEATLQAPGADGWFTIDARGQLSVAGVTRPAPMEVRAKALGEGRYRFVGQHAFKMTDFGVDPPTALLGTLKTGDAVTVHFDVTASR